MHLHLRRRHARHGDHDPRPAGRSQRESADRRHERRRTSATSPAFDIEFDNYGSTNRPQNRELLRARSGARCAKRGLVVEREVTQLYDPKAGTFLADRFVKGTCPKCSIADQYGDSCEKCGTTYSPTDLIDPVSTLIGRKPELRSAPHLFVEIEQLHAFLDEWTQSRDHLQPEVANYLQGPLPGRAAARLGRLAARPVLRLRDSRQPGQLLVRLVRRADRLHGLDRASGATSTGETLRRAGGAVANTTEIHHFIGKDITYFHTLFWPAMLKAAGFSLPRKVHIHGFLTVDGEKMSKSEGHVRPAATYLEHLDPAYLRYLLRQEARRRRSTISI